jgi:hypothetical protein
MDRLVFSLTYEVICFSVSTHSQEKIGMMWRRHRCLPLGRLAKLLWIVHKEQVSFYFEVFLDSQNCHAGRGWEIWGKHFLEVSLELYLSVCLVCTCSKTRNSELLNRVLYCGSFSSSVLGPAGLWIIHVECEAGSSFDIHVYRLHKCSCFVSYHYIIPESFA